MLLYYQGHPGKINNNLFTKVLNMKQLLSIFFTLLVFTHLHSNNINWSSPTILSGASVNASNPLVAVDASGDVVAVWIESNLLKSKTKTVSGSWSSTVNISATGASSPCLVSDSNGNATAVWVENGIVKAASKPFNSSWSASTALSTAGASAPTLCVDSSGDVVAAWVRSGNVEVSTKLFGMNWQNRTTITSSSAATPCVAAGGSGSNTRVVLTWFGISNGNNVIFSATKLISGGWTTPVVISENGAHNAAQPFVAVDGNGNAIAVWYAYDTVGVSSANVTLKTASRPSAGGWSAVSAISEPGVRNPSTLVARVAFDSIGNAIALWNISFDDETFSIQSAVKPVNGNWSDPVDLATSNLYAYTGDISVTSFGDILSLYMFYNGSSLLIRSVESDMNGFLNNFWSVPIIISTGSNNAFPKIAATVSGNAIKAAAVWLNYNGVNNNAVALTGSKTLPLPPTSLSVTQTTNNFGVFTEYYNTLCWTASTDPNVVGYLIFRNGLFIEQVGAGVTQFIDDNRAQNGSVSYGVTAIDAQQTQSVTASVSFP